MTQERAAIVTMKGKSVILLGPELKVGDTAPDFRVVDRDFNPVKLSDFQRKTCLISVVPSLDTGLCALQTKRFNDEIAKLPDGIELVTVSMDLPFAQKRFCDAENIDRIRVLSDSVWHEFGLHYGVLIKDMGLLARSIFVIGNDGKLKYTQIVPEISQHPDYAAGLAAVRAAASGDD